MCLPRGDTREAACQPRKESGVLRTRIQRGSRPGAALLLCGAVLIVPLLLSQNGAAGASPARPKPARHRPPDRPMATARPRMARDKPAPAIARTSDFAAVKAEVKKAKVTSSPAVPTATTTTAPSSVSGPTAVVATNLSAAEPATVPTTMATVPPTTAPSPPSPPLASTSAGFSGEGQVTYYDHPAGTCASPWLPFGTVVRITNPANGASVSCVVNDREQDTARAIDLATATFAEIAPLSQGVIDAELSW